jgi:hypothetical protein
VTATLTFTTQIQSRESVLNVEWRRDRPGAALVLPNGASSYDVRNLNDFQEQALQNVVNWYYYARSIRGRQACNGSLILVTGCHMASSWAMVSFKRHITEWPTNGQEPPQSSFCLSTMGNSTVWSSSHDQWGIARSGPKDVNPNTLNQCVFIRGFVLEEVQEVKEVLSKPSGFFRRRKPISIEGDLSGKVQFIQAPVL